MGQKQRAGCSWHTWEQSDARALKTKGFGRGKGRWANRLSWCFYWYLELRIASDHLLMFRQNGKEENREGGTDVRSPFEMLWLSSSLSRDRWAQVAFNAMRQLAMHNQMGSFVYMVLVAWFIFIVAATGHTQPPFDTFTEGLVMWASGHFYWANTNWVTECHGTAWKVHRQKVLFHSALLSHVYYAVNKERCIIASGCCHDSGNQDIGTPCPLAWMWGIQQAHHDQQHGSVLVGMFVRWQCLELSR